MYKNQLVKWAEKNRDKLFFIGYLWIGVAAFLLYLELTKPNIHTKDDLVYLSGPFTGYNWENRSKGSELIFSLANYPCNFQIKADFYPILKTPEFKNIAYSELLTVGIPKGYESRIVIRSRNVCVYSITSAKENYLDISRVIKKHNSIFMEISISILILLGACSIYWGYRSKHRTEQVN